MKKKFWVIILTILVFLSGALLGFATVFQVDDVVVEVSAISEDAKEEAQDIRAKLIKLYDKENIFFINEKKATDIVAEYPHFRVVSFKKDYPNRIMLSVTEDAEMYAVKKVDTNEYFILGVDGTVLAIRETPDNRLAGTNIVIEGLSVSGDKGSKLIGDARLNVILSFCNQMSERMNGICDNIEKVVVTKNAPQLCLYTHEGVKIYVANPEKSTLIKADKIAEKYLQLSDEERLVGCILGTDNGEEVFVDYQKEDINK